MKWMASIGIIFVACLITFFEWPRISGDEKKLKNTFLVLTILGVVIAILLMFFPDMPGPMDLIDTIFKPLGRF